MAAPYKVGVDYFPCDVGLANDRKFRRLKTKYGAWVVVAYLAILDLIYKDKGYYIEYNDNIKDDVIYEVSQYLSGRYQPSSETIEQAIDDMAACGLFSGDRFKLKILTSKRIQVTYYKCTLKRKIVEVDRNIWLLSISEMKSLSEQSPILQFFINDGNNGVNDGINSVNDGIKKQSKVKKSKVKKSKVVVTLPTKDSEYYELTEDDVNELQQQYPNIDVSLSLKRMASHLEQHPDKQRTSYDSYIKLWLQTDDDKAIKAQIEKKCNTGMNGEPSYDLEEYERTSMFDD